MPEWKLEQVFKNDINQNAFAEELFKANLLPKVNTFGTLKKKINQLKEEKIFFNLEDPVTWYFIFRAWLDASPMELTGLKTDEEAVAWILTKKLRIGEGSAIGLKAIKVELNDDCVAIIPFEIREKYIGVGYRKSF